MYILCVHMSFLPQSLDMQKYIFTFMKLKTVLLFLACKCSLTSSDAPQSFVFSISVISIVEL